MDTSDKHSIAFEPSWDRRGILKLLGLASLALPLSSCVSMMGGRVPELGSGDVGILNLALLLESLESEYYTKVLQQPYDGMNRQERILLTGIREHELAHRAFLRSALGSSAVDPQFDFSQVDFTNRNSVLTTARDMEELGVAAYNGAGNNLSDLNHLASAGRIVSVEARHAAVLHDLLDPFGISFAPTPLDFADNRSVVIKKAQPFLRKTA